MKKHTLLMAALVTTASCKGNSAGELSRRVDSYCADVASNLELAADGYEKVAPALDSGTLTPEQKNRIATLAQEGIGLSNDARMMKMSEVYKAAMFCISVRQIDQSRENVLLERLAKLNQTLSEQNLDAPEGHRGLSHVDAAKQLRELAGLAREVSALPKKP